VLHEVRRRRLFPFLEDDESADSKPCRIRRARAYTLFLRSYDLDLDKRLSEETTTLVENYEVRSSLSSPLPSLH